MLLGEKMPEVIVEVLEAFGRVLKVCFMITLLGFLKSWQYGLVLWLGDMLKLVFINRTKNVDKCRYLNCYFLLIEQKTAYNIWTILYQIYYLLATKEENSHLMFVIAKTKIFVYQVNAFDSVHVVDSLYRSKYLLASMGSHQQDLDLEVLETHTNDGKPHELQQKNHEDKGKNIMEESSSDPTEVLLLSCLFHFISLI